MRDSRVAWLEQQRREAALSRAQYNEGKPIERAFRQLTSVVNDLRGGELTPEEVTVLNKYLDDIKFTVKCMEKTK